MELEDAKKKSFGRGGAAWNKNIDGYDLIAAFYDSIRIVIIAPSVSAATHGQDPLRVGRLVIEPPQGGGHLISYGSCNYNKVRLAGSCPKNNTKAIKVVAADGCMHHLKSTASQTKG